MKNKDNEKIIENVKLKISISNFEEKEKIDMKSTSKIILKTAAVACCTLVSITGIVFAKDVGNFINKLFGKNSSEGVDTAVNNGYVAEVKTEYKKAEGISINVDSIIMDDFNFAANFNISLDESYNIDDFEHVEFEDLKIVDETGKTVFITHQYDTELAYKGAYSFSATKISDNELQVSLSATGNPELFPKSKHLTISMTKISTINNFYEGNWNFEVDVPEEFYNRTSTVYKVKNCNDDKTILTKAVLSNTAFKIELTTTTDKIDYELLHTSNPKSIYDKIALQKEYVETSDGKRFETAQRSDGDGGYTLTSDNTIKYYQTFNLTSFDATDEITVHIFTNTGEEIIIELEKSE